MGLAFVESNSRKAAAACAIGLAACFSPGAWIHYFFCVGWSSRVHARYDRPEPALIVAFHPNSHLQKMHSQFQTFIKNKHQIANLLKNSGAQKVASWRLSISLPRNATHLAPWPDLPLAPLKQDGGGLDRGFWPAEHCKRG